MSIYCKRLEQCINWNRLVTTLLTLQSCYKLSTTSQILRVSTSLSQSVSTTCDKSAERYVVTSLWSQACCNVWNWQHCYKLVHRLVTSLQANKLVTSLWEIWPCRWMNQYNYDLNHTFIQQKYIQSFLLFLLTTRLTIHHVTNSYDNALF